MRLSRSCLFAGLAVLSSACTQTAVLEEEAPPAGVTVGALGDGSYVFDALHVATLAIEVSDSDLATLRSDAEQEMGFEDFTYVSARIRYDGMEMNEVGLRVKGNNSRVSADGDAVPFKLDTNRYVDGQKLDGQTKLNLHNNVNQPAAMNEYLSYGALREHGIAASRTGWVDLTLNGTSLGLYTVVEQVGSKLLSRYYDAGDADLYKPEPPAGYLGYSGDAFEDYAGVSYEASNDTDHATFLQLVKTLDQSDASGWDGVIDVDSVLDYFATNVALGNWDTYVAMGHNYYLFEATPGRMVMLPWDLNLSQAASSAVCPAEVQRSGGGMGGAANGGGGMPTAIDASNRPQPPTGFDPGLLGGAGAVAASARRAPLHDKLLTDATYFARYKRHLASFLEGAGSESALHARIDAARVVLGERITDDAAAALRSTVSQRVAALTSALETTTECKAASAQ